MPLVKADPAAGHLPIFRRFHLQDNGLPLSGGDRIEEFPPKPLPLGPIHCQMFHKGVAIQPPDGHKGDDLAGAIPVEQQMVNNPYSGEPLAGIIPALGSGEGSVHQPPDPFKIFRGDGVLGGVDLKGEGGSGKNAPA